MLFSKIFCTATLVLATGLLPSSSLAAEEVTCPPVEGLNGIEKSVGKVTKCLDGFDGRFTQVISCGRALFGVLGASRDGRAAFEESGPIEPAEVPELVSAFQDEVKAVTETLGAVSKAAPVVIQVGLGSLAQIYLEGFNKQRALLEEAVLEKVPESSHASIKFMSNQLKEAFEETSKLFS